MLAGLLYACSSAATREGSCHGPAAGETLAVCCWKHLVPCSTHLVQDACVQQTQQRFLAAQVCLCRTRTQAAAERAAGEHLQHRTAPHSTILVSTARQQCAGAKHMPDPVQNTPFTLPIPCTRPAPAAGRFLLLP